MQYGNDKYMMPQCGQSIELKVDNFIMKTFFHFTG